MNTSNTEQTTFWRGEFGDEYFSDKQEMIEGRGHNNKLFKCDFGGFWMDNFPDTKLLDYGFEWKRITGLDNFSWWVFEKK